MVATEFSNMETLVTMVLTVEAKSAILAMSLSSLSTASLKTACVTGAESVMAADLGSGLEAAGLTEGGGVDL